MERLDQLWRSASISDFRMSQNNLRKFRLDTCVFGPDPCTCLAALSRSTAVLRLIFSCSWCQLGRHLSSGADYCSAYRCPERNRLVVQSSSLFQWRQFNSLRSILNYELEVSLLKGLQKWCFLWLPIFQENVFYLENMNTNSREFFSLQWFFLAFRVRSVKSGL